MPQSWNAPDSPGRQGPKPAKPKGNAARGCAFLGCGGTAAVAIIVVMLVSHGSGTGTPAVAQPPQAPVTTAAAAANLAPLTLGHFPATADGRLARAICRKWAGLRQEYVSRAADGTPYQMNQWFSSPAWSAVQKDGMKLGSAPAFSNLETALGTGMAGDDAGSASAAAIDRACRSAD